MEGKSSVRDYFNACIREGPNSHCADCGASAKMQHLEPQWASANLGIFVCISCSGAHRTLGTHISRVRSLFLDTWQDEEVKELGNAKGNTIWEANLPPFYVRPTPEDSNLFKEQFIKAKYERKEFVDGSHKGLDASTLPQKDGYLVKKGEVVKNWKKRWFILHGSLLCYFKKPPAKDDAPAGEILLSEASACDATNDLSVLDNHHNCFEIKTPLRNYFISAESPRMMFEWIQAIRQARHRLAQNIAILGSPKVEDIEEALEHLRKNLGSLLLHRKHQIEKKAFRDCFLGVELTDVLMALYRFGKREEAAQLAQRLFATGQVLSLNGPAEFVDGRFCYQLKSKP